MGVVEILMTSLALVMNDLMNLMMVGENLKTF